jgi:hypothetical protein
MKSALTVIAGTPDDLHRQYVDALFSSDASIEATQKIDALARRALPRGQLSALSAESIALPSATAAPPSPDPAA